MLPHPLPLEIYSTKGKYTPSEEAHLRRSPSSLQLYEALPIFWNGRRIAVVTEWAGTRLEPYWTINIAGDNLFRDGQARMVKIRQVFLRLFQVGTAKVPIPDLCIEYDGETFSAQHE
jgi:hypothetical protein